MTKSIKNDEPLDLVDEADKQECNWRDKDDYFYNFTLNDTLEYRCSDNLLHIWDGDVKEATLKMITTDPSQMQLQDDVEFKDKSCVNVTKEFLMPINY